jgi:hypothetical protein
MLARIINGLLGGSPPSYRDSAMSSTTFFFDMIRPQTQRASQSTANIVAVPTDAAA